jgi:alkanesulfonate monooxygenase SsuD/methylene tetrahydromethanopterin reductase-like flavin-dependent oxidoreductase (luciferase family)
MKVCLLGPATYAGKFQFGQWPVASEQCDPETAAHSYAAQLDLFVHAEELGFDWVSISEHHYSPGLMAPNPFVLAAAASQRTSRVKIAVLGPLMPLSNPVRVAEEVAMLDSISGGRAVVLLLRGIPNELLTYSADGEPPADSRGMTQEATQLVLRAWREHEPFSWEGEHFTFKTVSVWPRSLQDPHPPVFYSGNSLESAEFAAAHRLNLAIGFAPPEVVATNVEHYRQHAIQAGWEPGSDNVLYRARALVAPTQEQADEIVERAREAVARRLGLTPGAPAPGGGGGAPGVAGFQFHGTPQTILEQARAYRDAGVGILDVAFAPDAYGRGVDASKEALSAFGEVLADVQAL